MLPLIGCAKDNHGAPISDNNKNEIVLKNSDNEENEKMKGHLTTNDYVRDIVNHEAFKGFGELLLKVLILTEEFEKKYLNKE